MRTGTVGAATSILAGTAVLVTVGDTVVGSGNYYLVPVISLSSPGMAELALGATLVTGLGAVTTGSWSLLGSHSQACLSATVLSVLVLSRPAYGSLPVGDLVFTATAVLGAVVTCTAAGFVTLVEVRVFLSRLRRSNSRQRATG